MCNLYRQRSGPQSSMDLSHAMRADIGNLQPGDIYPDYPAPIIRTSADGVRELALARRGIPTSRKVLMDAAASVGSASRFDAATDEVL